MEWVSSQPVATVFLVALVVVAAVALVPHLVLHRFVKPGRRENVGATAAAYMTALGSLFAILTGFLISAEYTTLRHTQDLVANEASGASRLAWATQGLPAVDASLVQEGLATYLNDLDRYEWVALADGVPERSRANRSLSHLQATVFDIGSRSYAPASSVEGMRTALSDVTSARRERIAIASQSMPFPLFALSMLAGLALIVNAIAVTLRSGRGSSIVAIGIIAIVALDLGLILAISEPFQGGFTASRRPIAELYTEVHHGAYLPWVQAQ